MVISEMENITPEQVEYRNAEPWDLPDVAGIFLQAFPDSVRHYVGHRVRPGVIEDIFEICLDSEPSAFFVAVVDKKIAGYIFAPSKFSAVFSVAISNGHLLRMFTRWISGHYRIGVKPVYTAIKNWLILWRETRADKTNTDARILSVAVDPNYQGLGIGSKLVELALDYLESNGVERVQLEVRPENLPAKHIYEKLGFHTEGRTRDTQGDWLIMLKDLPKHAA